MTYNIGFEGWVIFPLQQLSPVDAIEELMCFDFRGPFGSQAMLWAAVKESSQQVFGGGWNNLRPRKV